MRATVLFLIIFAAASVARADSFAQDVSDAIGAFNKADSGIGKFLSGSVGYVVYPNVGKGGLGFGGAHGNGLVFQKGKAIGKSGLTQVTFGLQAGGQEFSEIVFFETAKAFQRFKKGEFSVAAQVSAVAAAEGAAAKAKYSHGVAIFVAPKGGLMFEASVGGQKLTFHSR